MQLKAYADQFWRLEVRPWGGLTIFFGSALASASEAYKLGYSTPLIFRAAETRSIWKTWRPSASWKYQACQTSTCSQASEATHVQGNEASNAEPQHGVGREVVVCCGHSAASQGLLDWQVGGSAVG